MADTPSLIQQLLDLQGRSALVIGDVMLDRYIHGQVHRISPEAPIPILSHETTKITTGGAANVARNLSQLGCNVSLIGAVGQDSAAQELTSALGRIPQLFFAPLVCAERQTTVKTRFLSSGQQMLRVDTETVLPLDEMTAEQLTAQAAAAIGHADILVISDYAKGCLTAGTVQTLIKAAKSNNKTVIIDPKSADFSDYAGADLITPNLAELRRAACLEDDSITAITKAARQLMTSHDIAAMLVTVGARGMVLVRQDSCVHLPAHPCEVYDVSGAGDTVIALMAAGLVAGLSAEQAAQTANLGASLVVAKSGTACLCIGELLASLPDAPPPLTLTDAQEKAAGWRRAGDRIGFTNGCFDLLHSGHLHILSKTAAQCDRLIVGLNSDASIAGLKGPSRPLQNQIIRAGILGQLPFIDGIVLFDEPTPATLIDALRPDLLAKGGDYRPEDIVGYDTVRRSGGTVAVIDLLEGYSTSAFLQQ